MDSWKDMIVIMSIVKQELHKHDRSHVLPYYLPKVAATDEEISIAEKVLGFDINPEYKEFLMNANGWDGFYLTVDLFGTNDLAISEKYNTAISALKNYVVSTIEGFNSDDLLPIAASAYDKDIFAISKPFSSHPGVVIWLANEEIDRFPSFTEFFLSMIDYNRSLIADITDGMK